MKIAVVTIRKEPYYRRAAVENGLKRLGYKIVLVQQPEGKESLLVLWNKKKGPEETMADNWERQGGTVIVMENGYLQQADKSHYALSTHGHNGSGWFPIGAEDRFTKLGFPVKPWRSDNHPGYWLVCAQRGIGSKLMASPRWWDANMVRKLESQGRKVKLRPHPGNSAPKVPLVDDLKGAAQCVIWSSGSGVRALVEGVPVIWAAPHWICSDQNREKALHTMSHGQWHHEEIATGEPFARMAAENWGPSWR